MKTLPNPHTLAGSRALPQEEIAEYYLPKDWQAVRSQEYSGYVIMTGMVDPDGEVGSWRVVQRVPDPSRDLLARQLAQGVRLRSMRAGSWIWPTATVYVIFYESPLGNRALIYARISDYSGRTSYSGSNSKASFGDGRYFKTAKF